MKKSKLVQIADSVHGSIQASYLEKRVISTHAFNRLHNVLQNSTVFLTYPSNQTKRFAHSLGTMHLGGQMFYYSVINSEQDMRNKFINEINKELSDIVDDDDFNRYMREFLGKRFNSLLETKEFKSLSFCEPLYKLNTPNIIETNQVYVYTAVYQSIRLAALLHDLGHPPFSHITEYALKEVLKIITQKHEMTNREKMFSTIIDRKDLNGKSIDKDIHEQIGNRISSRLIETVIRDMRDDSKSQIDTDFAKELIFYWIVHKMVKYILEDGGNTGVFSSIHRLISGAIDCDRLDYVNRDLKSSGFLGRNIEYDRLVPSMKILENNNEFIFCPSIQTLSTVEDFFQSRWTLYKYVIFHHRVVKTDYLLGKAIVAISQAYLENSSDESIDLEKNLLPFDISGLWKALKGAYSDEGYFNPLIQWDDSWLLTVLRQIYFLKFENSNSIVEYQLEEILSSEKHYRSIIKRMDDFLEIDKVVKELIESKWLDFETKMEDLFKNKKAKLYSKKLFDELKSSNGFILNRINAFFEYFTKSLPDTPLFEPVINKALKNVSIKHSIKDSFAVFKKLKTGLEQKVFLYKGETLVPIDDISKITHLLRQSQSVFPTFFIYIFEGKSVNIEDFLYDLGVEISDGLENLISTTLKVNN